MDNKEKKESDVMHLKCTPKEIIKLFDAQRNGVALEYEITSAKTHLLSATLLGVKGPYVPPSQEEYVKMLKSIHIPDEEDYDDNQ